ncbi:hypothetical protein F5Y15DRAFT_413137 [Xylariaceae sp. FL0016]|nr:hypothetical protein F5Y15DRAFT_413137 [Xylariaceae sp. FL0016]
MDSDSSSSIEWTPEQDRTIVTMKAKGKTWAEIRNKVGESKQECHMRHKEIRRLADKIGLTIDELNALYASKDKKAKGKGKEKAKPKKKRVVIVTPLTSESSESSDSSESTESSADDSSTSSEDQRTDPEAELRASRRHYYMVELNKQYTNQKKLKHSGLYSPSDHKILAVIEARYRANKWMEIQSEFFNATGQIIDAKIIERMFQQS